MGKRRTKSVLKDADVFTVKKAKDTKVSAFHITSSKTGSRTSHSSVNISNDGLLLPAVESNLGSLQFLSNPTDVTESMDMWMTEEECSVREEAELENNTQRTHAHPLDDWRPLRQIFIDEVCRLDGRGEYRSQVSCLHCVTNPAEFRCDTCLCTGLYCKDCIMEMHRLHPFHRVKRWSHESGMFIACSLKSLGLRIQLNHPMGQVCPNPVAAKARDAAFIVIDIDGIHAVALDYCGCFNSPPQYLQLLRARLWPATIHFPATAMTFRSLDHLQLLSYESKLSIHDWYDATLRNMDNTGLAAIPDRKEEVRRMVREYGHIHLLKRAGRAHDPAGVENTSCGECAVLCPACPHPGKNIPDNWHEVSPREAWLYAEFVGLDANFRSKRKNVSSEDKDPALSDGYAYFVPAKQYKEYLSQWQGETQPKSKCVSHEAVNSADTKDTKGFIVSGIGAVDDVRHGFKRPNATGDLQKGERYINMDYLFYFSHLKSLASSIFVSYDIACQYSINFYDRMLKKFPTHWPINAGNVRLQWLVPKFHLPVHIPKCQWNFSFNFRRGVGRTEGEALERNWPELNRLSASTKEMGPGARRDTMDEHMGDSNWRKVTQIGEDLLTRMKGAIPEAVKSLEQLSAMEESLSDGYDHHLAEWRSEMERWEEDGNSKESPFKPRTKAPTLADVRLKLAEDESKTEWSAGLIKCEISPDTFVSLGLELQNIQAKLRREVDELGIHATSLQRAKILEQSNVLRNRIKSWVNIQAIYMPTAILLHIRNGQATSSPADLQPYNLKLWLPSDLEPAMECHQALRDYEWGLRVKQGIDLLSELRSDIRLCTFLERRKKNWSQGVRANTRSNTAIQQVKDRIRWRANQYEITRTALKRLAPVISSTVVLATEWSKHFLPLEDGDLNNLPGDTLQIGEGSTRLSWIWLAVGLGAQATQGEELSETLRINWCRARARALRWEEEIKLLSEEMRRVESFLTWHAEWWYSQAERRSQCEASPREDIVEGLRAYAQKQALLRLALRDRFVYLWRYVKDWRESGVVPTSRRWFTDVIRPREGPGSIFAPS